MKFTKLPKISFRNYGALVWAKVSVLLFFGISLILLIMFLYKDFYQTIVHANEVIVLKQEVSLENIDLVKFNKILTTHNYKINSILGQNIEDPFNTDNYIPLDDNIEKEPVQ